MSIWERILSMIAEASERTFGAVLEMVEQRQKRRDEAIFSIALIALSAKMAKADGVVTDDEIAAFRHFFAYPQEEAAKVQTVFDLAKGDVRGFDSYAKQIGRIFRDDVPVLEDVLDCLFFVALADGVLHPDEMTLLRAAADAFRLDILSWRRIKAAHLGADQEDPYAILGVPHDITDGDLRIAYRDLAKEHHPDALIARGVPQDLARIAEHRMAVINDAYERVVAERAA